MSIALAFFVVLQEESVEALIKGARAKSAAGDARGALADLDRAITLDPDRLDALFLRGVVRYERLELELAEADFTRAIEKDPKRPEPFLMRGRVRNGVGNRDGTMKDYTQSIALQPGHEAHFRRGMLKELQGDVAGALEDLSRAVELDPAATGPRTERTRLRMKAGAFVEAARDLDPSIAASPKDASLRVRRGTMYLYAHRLDEALAELNAAMEVDPDHADAWLQRAHVHEARVAQDEAKTLFALFATKFPAHPMKSYALAALEAQPGPRQALLAEAIERNPANPWPIRKRAEAEDLDRAIDLDPYYAPTLVARARFLREGDPAGALRDAREAVRLAPGFAEARFERGDLHLWRWESDEALKEFTRAIELKPDRADWYTYRSCAKHHLGDFAGAIADSTEAIRRDPNSVWAHNNRGWVKLSAGDFAGALADFDRTLALSPKHETARSNRAVARRGCGDLKGALEQIEANLRVFDIASFAAGEMRMHRAEIHAELGEKAEAAAAWRELVDTTGFLTEEGSLLAIRAYAQLKLGKAAEALATADRAVALDPERKRYWTHSDGLLRRGQILAALGRREEAIRDFEPYLRQAKPWDRKEEARKALKELGR